MLDALSIHIFYSIGYSFSFISGNPYGVLSSRYGWDAIRILAVALDLLWISAVRNVIPNMSSWYRFWSCKKRMVLFFCLPSLNGNHIEISINYVSVVGSAKCVVASAQCEFQEEKKREQWERAHRIRRKSTALPIDVSHSWASNDNNNDKLNINKTY